jgi:hypothetical protein
VAGNGANFTMGRHESDCQWQQFVARETSKPMIAIQQQDF